MSIFTKWIEYIKDNPNNLWFKRKLYGWGWVPVRWQGWVVVIVSVGIFVLGINLAERDDAPGVAVLSFALMLGIIFYFGYTKGEKPRWQWGPPESK